MDNLLNNPLYIVVDSETYDFNESTDKPILEGSALYTLNRIEDLIKKYLSDPVAQEEFEFDSEVIKERMQQIKGGYDQKFDQLCWGTKAVYRVVNLIYSMINCLFSFARISYRFETEQDLIDKTLLRIDNLLQAPTALPLQLVTDVQKSISGYLDFKSLCQFALVNRDAYKLAASSMLDYAREYGFQGEEPPEAKKFMIRLFDQEIGIWGVMYASSFFIDVDKEFLLKLPSFLFRDGELLQNLKSTLTTNEMFDLFSVVNLYSKNDNNDFKQFPQFWTFVYHAAKDWEKTAILDEEMSVKGARALRKAIEYGELGCVNLLLQHGIKPKAEHLTLSLQEGKNPEVVRLLLDHQASIGQEEEYIFKGLNSLSLEIRQAIYDFDLNYHFSKGYYLCDILATHCRYNIDRVVDLQHVLKSASKKGLSLGEQCDGEYLNDEKIFSDLAIGEFKPLFKNTSALYHIFTHGNDPVTHSLREDILDAVLLLLKYGANKTVALCYASAYGHTRVVEKILEKFESFKAVLPDLLWMACGGFQIPPLPDFSKNLGIVKLLLKYGASTSHSQHLEKGDSYKKSTLELAQDNGLTEIAEVLRAHQNFEDQQKQEIDILFSLWSDPNHCGSETETEESDAETSSS
ncbi:MAG: hypothetical protein H0T62_08740 [Parachlamydiaceae bacterium]|nr:hypothetical protein [Parachlamydiaceae bacterium]